MVPNESRTVLDRINVRRLYAALDSRREPTTNMMPGTTVQVNDALEARGESSRLRWCYVDGNFHVLRFVGEDWEGELIRVRTTNEYTVNDWLRMHDRCRPTPRLTTFKRILPN